MNEREIFERAVEIQDPTARGAFLDESCGQDARLRADLELLLASHFEARQFMDVPLVEQLGFSGQNQSPMTIEQTRSSRETLGSTTKSPFDEDDEDDEERGDSHSVVDLSFLEPARQPGSIGVLGHYAILRVLGQGAFGIVFKAFDEKLHRHVAIKAMNPQLAATSPPRKRFLREARSAAAVKHENVVQVHAVEEQPLPYLVMEYVDGETLQQKLDTAGPLDVAEFLHLGRQMAAGLAAAHEKGLVHRDIKPGNILLETGAEQKVKITDFGLARAADDATMTRTGTIAGTPMYMAPEQALGQPVDHRADLFSLGSVFYQMACGRAPFRGANALAVLKRVVDEAPRPIQEIWPEVPDWLCNIIAKLHARNPDERFSSSKELADLLGRCQLDLQANGKVESARVAAALVKPGLAANGTPDGFSATENKPLVDEGGPRAASLAAAPRKNHLRLVTLAAIGALLGSFVVSEFAGATRLTPWFRPAAARDDSTASSDGAETASSDTKQYDWPADAPAPALEPFDSAQALRHQEAWAKYLKTPVEYTNSQGMKFRLIPPGEYTMGIAADTAEDVVRHDAGYKKRKAKPLDTAPVHRVRLTRAYYFGVYEVTREQYDAVMGENPAGLSPPGESSGQAEGDDPGKYPVDSVSFIDAAKFCIRLSELERLQPVYADSNGAITLIPGNGYRLPTEAEWEYACRAGTTTVWFHGDQVEDLANVAWFVGNSSNGAHPVGRLKANPFGLFDVHGNLWEWCQDWYEAPNKSQFNGETLVNPQGPATGETRLVRGGCWHSQPSACVSAIRFNLEPSNRHANRGFRVSIDIAASRPGL